MIIFDERNVQIIFRDGKYYLRTDLGHFVPEFVEIETSKEDAEKVMEDVRYALQIVWDYQNKLWGLA